MRAAARLALHHGRNGVRVNVVSPGPIEFEGGNWDMIKGTMEKFYNSQLRQHPAGDMRALAEMRAIAEGLVLRLGPEDVVILGLAIDLLVPAG